MPMVEAVRARHSRKTGRVAITFEVDAPTWQNMRQKALDGAFFGVRDYIAGTLNTAFLECFPLQAAAETPPLEKKPGDSDDDIPF